MTWRRLQQTARAPVTAVQSPSMLHSCQVLVLVHVQSIAGLSGIPCVYDLHLGGMMSHLQGLVAQQCT